MKRDRLKILAYLASEVVIFLGVFFIVCMSLGVTKDQPPGPGAVAYVIIVLVFLLLTPFLLILTRVMMLKKSERKPDIEALCEHLRLIGLGATVESKQQKILSFRERRFMAVLIYWLIFILIFVGFMLLLLIPVETFWMLVGVGSLILGLLMLLFFDPQSNDPTSILYYGNPLFLGSVRIANRNIDLIELQKWPVYTGGWEDTSVEDKFGCFFVVEAKVEGSEDKLKAETKPVKVRKEVVDIMWEGGELAQTLNSDANLRDTLHHMKERHLYGQCLTIKPDRELQCVRIVPKRGYYSPKAAFPSIEAFQVCDRIAQHIRSIVNARP
jgi:hypothetical protein